MEHAGGKGIDGNGDVLDIQVQTLVLFVCLWWPPEQVWKGCLQSGDNLAVGQVKREWQVSSSISSLALNRSIKEHILDDESKINTVSI